MVERRQEKPPRFHGEVPEWMTIFDSQQGNQVVLEPVEGPFRMKTKVYVQVNPNEKELVGLE